VIFGAGPIGHDQHRAGGLEIADNPEQLATDSDGR
jgi:hypothetical protein